MSREVVEIIEESDVTWTIEYKDSDGNALDLTGATILFTAKKKENEGEADSEAEITKDVSSHTDAAGGISAIVLTNEDTGVGVVALVADIVIVDSSGNIEPFDSFDLAVKRKITRRIA